MASLPILSSATCTSTTPNSSGHTCRRPIFAKPSYFITHSKRSRSRSGSLTVSCDGGHSPRDSPKTNSTESTSQGRKVVDRRNMLVGMGGLYAGANLISTTSQASAEPMPAPDFSNCHKATYKLRGPPPEEEKKVDCCLQNDKNIIQYKLPPVVQMKIRPSAHTVTPEYISKYNEAIKIMKERNGEDPLNFLQQANIHCAYCNGAYRQPGDDKDKVLQVHASWLFFPFHRWYVYFFERILGKLIGDPNFALPFWNWDNPKGMTIPPMFLDPKSQLYDPLRDPNATEKDAVVDFSDPFKLKDTSREQVVCNNRSVLHKEMDTELEKFMGNPYRRGDSQDTGYKFVEGTLESGSHTSVHIWVGRKDGAGENMGNFYSAGRDPLFYSHHANVDRMWTLYQANILNRDKDPSGRNFTERDYVDTEFLFYDEEAQLVRVRVGDCLDNRKMGYEFESVDISSWEKYAPPKQTPPATQKRDEMITLVRKAPPTVFPVVLDRVVKVLVPKTKKGKADELLVIENITVDVTKFSKFDVFVNDEDDDDTNLDKASYAGSLGQVPHKPDGHSTVMTTSISFKLNDLYENMDVDDDDSVLVTLVPRHEGTGLSIGGIKIIENTN